MCCLHLHLGLASSLTRNVQAMCVLPWRASATCVGDRTPVLEVTLVADEHDGHVGVGMLQRILEPAREVVERLASSDVVHLRTAPSIRRKGGRAP
eukprot:2108244-Rhodomonas_salina.1